MGSSAGGTENVRKTGGKKIIVVMTRTSIRDRYDEVRTWLARAADRKKMPSDSK